MKIDILTIFPEMFEGFLTQSIIKRAIEKGLVEIKIHNGTSQSPISKRCRSAVSAPRGGASGQR